MTVLERTEKVTTLAKEIVQLMEKHSADNDLLYASLLIVQNAVDYQRKVEEHARYAKMGAGTLVARND